MGRSRYILFLALGLTASIRCGPVMAAPDEAVILSTNLPGLSAGTIFDDDRNLSLPSGANAILLFRSGEMLRLNGPFDGKPLKMARADGAERGVAGLAALLRAEGVSASVMGATRGWPAAARRLPTGADVTVALERSGIYCVGPGDTVWLSRQAGGTAPIRLRHGGSLHELTWLAGAFRIEWPSDLSIDDGDVFEVLDEAGAPATSLIFRRLETAPTASAWVAERILAGCRDQAEPVLRELASSVADDARR